MDATPNSSHLTVTGMSVGAAHPDGLSDDPEVDWSRFRGSPPEAIEQTLAWLDARHGGAARYLATQCGVPEAKLATLRRLAAEA